jgi:hypothetical protein
MIQIWVLMIITLVLAYLYEHAYIATPDRSLSRQKISVIFIILTILMGGFLGLRTSYNDTFTYIHTYKIMKTIPEFWNSFNPSLSADPGFNICNAIMKTMGINTQNWLMIYALITIALYMSFIRKNHNQLVFNLYLFFCIGGYTFAGAAIKQSMATAICFFALEFAFEKKWIRYFIFVFIAMTFHVYAVVFLFVPFLMFKPWTRKTGIMLVATVLIGLLLPNILGTITSITSSIGESYTVGEFSGAGVNIFRVLVCNIPFILGFLFRNSLFEESSERENLMFNLSMINGFIMFIGLFGTANYFARLANYFVLAQAITIPWIINKLPGKNRKILKFGAIIGYLLFFYYSTNIVYGRFADLFHRLTVGQYLLQLF